MSATGAGPITYRWLQDGKPLLDAISAQLILTNVTRIASGSYEVLVTNPGGSVRSSAADLWVRAPQLLGSPVLLPDGTLEFISQDFESVPLQENELSLFRVEESSDLLNWAVLDAPVTLQAGKLVVLDAGLRTNICRFYRMVESRTP